MALKYDFSCLDGRTIILKKDSSILLKDSIISKKDNVPFWRFFGIVFIFTFLALIQLTSAADPGHAAATIGSGTFESGDYTFPINLNVLGNLSIAGTRFFVNNASGFVGIGTASPNAKLDVIGEILRTNTRISAVSSYPLGRSSPDGETMFAIDPTWSNAELQKYFSCASGGSVNWYNDPTAPAGYTISINKTCQVGGPYNAGFPYIPIENGSTYYMEVWAKENTSSLNGSDCNYLGSAEYDENFTSTGGNPGSYGYWAMSCTNVTSSWVKYSGYISGFGDTTGKFENASRYWTPLALFGYSYSSSMMFISGWKVVKVTNYGNRHFIGAVGINTTTPSQTLNVLGTFNVTGLSYFASNISVGGFQINNLGTPKQTTDAATKAYVDAVTGGGAATWNLTGAVVHLSDTSDRVSIGATTSNYKLDVNGNVSLNNSLFVTNAGNVGIGTASPGEALDVNGRIQLRNMSTTGSGIWYDGTATTDRAFLGMNVNSDSTFRLYSGALASNIISARLDTGNIGFNTTNPTHTLNILGTFNVTGLSYFGANISMNSFRIVNMSDPQLTQDAATKNYVDTAISGVNGSSSAADDWNLSGTNLFPKSLSYNVGIGTSTSSYPLTVSTQSNSYLAGFSNVNLTTGVSDARNNLYISGYSAETNIAYGMNRAGAGIILRNLNETPNTYVGVTFMDTGGNGVAGIFGILVNDSANQGDLAFATRANNGSFAETMRILGNGNVGINTTTPTHKLNVVGTANITGLSYFASNISVGGFQINNLGTPSLSTDAATKAYVDAVTGGGAATWNLTGAVVHLSDTSDRVSIGATTSNYKLDVNGNVSLNNSLFVTNAGNVGIGTSAPTHKLNVLGTANITGNLTVNGGDLFVNTNSRLVGIGTSAPNSELDVAGTIITNESLWQNVYSTDDGLQLYLPFSEAKGTTAYDKSGNANDGTLTGNAEWTNGSYGYAINFPGGNSTNYVTVSNSNNFNFQTIHGPSTVEVWFKPNALTGNGYIFSDNCFEWGVYHSSSTIYGAAYGSVNGGTISAGQWYHAVVTHSHPTPPDNSTQINNTLIKFYLNGVLKGQTTYTVTGGNNGYTDSPYTIGDDGCSADKDFNGTVDEVRVYNRALNSEEVRAHYLRGTQSDGYIKANNFKIFNNTWSELLRVTAAGNLGLGTTTPSHKLNVLGTANITGLSYFASNISVGGFQINNLGTPKQTTDAATKDYVDTAISGVNGSSSAADDWNLSGTNLFPKSLGYNVGIGTISPRYSLSIVKNQDSATYGSINNSHNGSSASAGFELQNHYGGMGMITYSANHSTYPYQNQLYTFGTNNQLNLFAQGTNSSMTFATASVERMRIDTNGNVGIGTSAPTKPLTIYRALNNITITGGEILRLNGDSDGNGVGRITGIGFAVSTAINPSTFIGQIVDSASGWTNASIIFATKTGTADTEPTEKMRIVANGNVGIGTTAPTQKLEVSGNLNLSATSPTIYLGNSYLTKTTGGDVIISD